MEKTQTLWWKKAVIYQIYPRSFCDSNDDGVGDIPGIISRLDYLQDLGIDAIWLSPVYKSPNCDYGYDIADYYSINPEYGTLGDMKNLIAEAKKRDIRVIMDLVVNHTSDQHPWFQASRDPASPYRDYYIWRKPRIDRRGHEHAPNNWTSYFTGSAWERDDKSGEYYLHLFTKNQPDLNYHNHAVIDEVKKIMKFWLELGVAGFRCDVINLLYKESLKDGKRSLFARGSEHYVSTTGVHKILREINRDVLKPYQAFTVGEAQDVDLKQAKLFTSGDELDEVFSFDHVNHAGVGFKSMAQLLKKAVIKWQSKLDWNALFLSNHDQPREVSVYGSEKYRVPSAQMLATLLLTLRGTPFIYQGQEIGMTDAPIRFDRARDQVTKLVYDLSRSHHLPNWLAMNLALRVGRDKARSPMQWGTSVNGGFSVHEPWLPVNPNYKTVNVKHELGDDSSVWNYYHKLINLRANTPALLDGTIEFLHDKKHLLTYRRQLGDSTYVIIVNLSYKPIKTLVHMQGAVVLANYRRRLVTGRITLSPYEAVIVKLG